MAQRPLDPAGGSAPKINVKLPRPQYDRVLELANTSGGTVSELVRAALDRELEREDEGPPDPGS